MAQKEKDSTWMNNLGPKCVDKTVSYWAVKYSPIEFLKGENVIRYTWAHR